MSAKPKTAAAHNAELTGQYEFTPSRIPGLKLPARTFMKRKLIVEAIYKQLRENACLAEIAPEDTVLANIEKALRDIGIGKREDTE